ncbi:hypothetical protein RISK_004309 [Rhodopirellula islandica]|uniref:Uncharacterized protein n=1 Tax=Rhodopirellula islandica TaxID=595434 RepID=A0A0J1BB99_RHOIS|nr:hypothetical protein RISK_004309 [Rhodopirellula islandica]
MPLAPGDLFAAPRTCPTRFAGFSFAVRVFETIQPSLPRLTLGRPTGQSLRVSQHSKATDNTATLELRGNSQH